MNILIFIASLQIKLFSIFQIRKLFFVVIIIFFKIYWDDSPKFSKPWENKFSVRDFRMIVDGWHGWYFHLDCFVADNFVAGLLEEENTISFLSFLKGFKSSAPTRVWTRGPASDSKSSVITTRLKGPDQSDWSIMHPIYIYTSYFSSRTTTLLHATMKHLYQMFRNYFITLLYCSQTLFDSVDTASPLGSDGSHLGHGTKCSRGRNRHENFPVECPDRGLNPRPSDSKSGVIATRLKCLDQLDWSVMHPIYLYTSYFASRTTTVVFLS